MTIKDLFFRVLYKFGYNYRFGAIRKLYEPKSREFYLGKKILSGQEGNDAIARKIKEGKPFLVGRMGGNELMTAYNHHLGNTTYAQNIKDNMKFVAGFFPVDDEHMARFAELTFENLKRVDIMGVWFHEGGEQLFSKYCPDPIYIDPLGIEPHYHRNPWSQQLRGKKVLVIHPFEDSIRHQYTHNRTKIFEKHAEEVLPEFELVTMKTVQSHAGVTSGTGFKTWFDALEHMSQQVRTYDFDIALIGAGAYGLPLGQVVRDMGKQAIHMGGATQLLFGIIGQRWVDRENINQYFNDTWKRPYEHETPTNLQSVENGAYW